MPAIHGPGGKFHLHGGKLESMSGDADMNRPAAGRSSSEQQRSVNIFTWKLNNISVSVS